MDTPELRLRMAYLKLKERVMFKPQTDPQMRLKRSQIDEYQKEIKDLQQQIAKEQALQETQV